VGVPLWATLLVLLAAAGCAAFAGFCFQAARRLAGRSSLKGIRAHLDDQDEAIRGVRRAWAQASEEMTRILEDIGKERGKNQAASARAAKAEKRVNEQVEDDPVSNFEKFRKRALAAHLVGDS